MIKGWRNLRTLLRILFAEDVRVWGSVKKYSKADREYRWRELKRWWERQNVKATWALLDPNEFTRDASKSMSDSYNSTWLPTENFALHMQPTSVIWLYNISRNLYTRSNSFFREFKFLPNKEGQAYQLATSIPHPFRTEKTNVDTNEMDFVFHDAKRIAMDLINPANCTLDQTKDVMGALESGNNYGIRGMFWSEHNPPLPEELAAAELRMQKFYRELLKAADAIVRLTPMGFWNLHIGPEHYLAADYFKVKPVWYRPEFARNSLDYSCETQTQE